MSGFFHMGGYGTFIWSAYGVAAFVMAALVVASLRNLKANEKQLEILEEEKRQWARRLEEGSSQFNQAE